MARKSKATEVAERMKDRMTRLSTKIKEDAPFGVTQYSQSEFRKKASEDQSFRMAMSERMGPGNFLEVMGTASQTPERNRDGSQPA